MEGTDQYPSLAAQHRLGLSPANGSAVHRSEDLNVGTTALDDRSADKNGVDGLVQAGDIQVRFEGFALAPESVAPDRDVDSTEIVLVGTAVSDL